MTDGTRPMKVSDEAKEAAQDWINRYCDGDVHPSDHGELAKLFARFEAEVRKDEREKCAKVADIWDSPQAEELARSEGASSRDRKTARIVSAGIAAAIRSLSDDGEGGNG